MQKIVELILRSPLASFFIFLGLTTTGLLACSLAVTRPVQLMSETESALRAAKEVNAESLTPELFQRANEAYLKAQNEYKMKNFVVAKEYASLAKRLAEEAEFQALSGGAQRTSLLPSEDPLSEGPSAEPYDYPTPTGTPAFLIEQGGGKENSEKTPPPL